VFIVTIGRVYKSVLSWPLVVPSSSSSKDVVVKVRW